MKKKKNNDQSKNKDGQVSDYEEMLDGFSSGDEVKGDEKKEGDDDIALSNLLGDSDSLGLEGEADELKELNLDDISDLTFDDIAPEEMGVTEESEAEKESVSKTSPDKLEIDLEELEQETSSDYSSVLSEMENGETAETETESAEIDAAETKTEKIPVDTFSETITEEIPEAGEDTDVSYASLIDEETDESSAEESIEETSSEEFAVGAEGEDVGTDKGVFEKLTDTEYSIEEEEIVSDIDEEFAILKEAKSEEEDVVPDFSAEETTEETFVISSGGEEEPVESEEDFLKLDEEVSSDEGILAGVTDVKQVAPVEVLLEGIEMDPEEQISAVTRAELLLAQGKEKEASELFAHVSENKGITPWVSKRLRRLNIQDSTENDSTTETETTIESESE